MGWLRRVGTYELAGIRRFRLLVESYLDKTMPKRTERVEPVRYIPLTLPLTLTEEPCQSSKQMFLFEILFDQHAHVNS